MNNNNNNTINNNYGSLQDLTLPFKIPMGMRMNFCEIYRRFGHATSKRVASPGLAHTPVTTPTNCHEFIQKKKGVKNCSKRQCKIDEREMQIGIAQLV